MVNIEHGPKPNSYRGIIFEAYNTGISYSQVLSEYNLTDGQGARALSGLIDGGYFPEGKRDELLWWKYGIAVRGQKILNPCLDSERLKISERKGGETATMFPLLIRGFGLDEIWGITRFTLEQMHNVLGYLRREQGVLARPTKNESNRTRLQTRRIKRILSGEAPLIVDEENSFAVAKGLIREKLVPVVLDSWDGLHQFYTLRRRKLPKLFSDRLRLEAFFAARMKVVGGNTRHLIAYKNIGDQVDLEWFDEYLSIEEEFIAEALESDRHFQADGSGIYYEDDQGNRWRPVDVVDGKLVITGLSELRTRRMLREGKFTTY